MSASRKRKYKNETVDNQKKSKLSQLNQSIGLDKLTKLDKFIELEQLVELNQHQLNETNQDQLVELNQDQLVELNQDQLVELNQDQLNELNQDQLVELNQNQFNELHQVQLNELNDLDDHGLKSNSRPSVIITELPVELLLKIFSYTDNIFRNLTQTCQRFNELCSNDFTLRLNFDRIINGEVPIINRDYRKVIIEGSEIPEHLLNLLSSINFDSVSSLKITRAHSEKKGSARFCRILARSYLKLLKMFPNIETLELNSVRLSVILKSDIISVDNQPNLPYLTSLKVRDVNDDVYQCLLKANLIKIDARVVKGGCKNFMNLLQHRKMNLKHLEADNFDYTFNNFRMEALEYLYYDYSVRHFNDNLWLFSSPMLKNCKIKVQYFQLSEMIERKFLLQSQMLKLTIKGVSKETVIQHQPGLLNKFSSVEKLMWENDVIWEKK